MESIPPLAQLLLYVLYRLFRCVVQLELDLWLLAKRFWRSKAERASDDLTPVEVGAIVLRRRLMPGDIARDVDFIVWHKRTAPFAELWSSTWSIYSLNQGYVYFVECSIPAWHFQCQSMSQLQFERAVQVARMPLSEFWRRCQPDDMDQKGRMIAVATMANSGSEKFARLSRLMIPETGRLGVYQDVDVLSMLAVYTTFYSMSLTEVRKTLGSILTYIRKDLRSGQSQILLMRSNCTRLVPHLHAVEPSMTFVYLARDDLEGSVRSYVACSNELSHHILKLWKMLPSFCDWITPLCQSEAFFVNMLRPNTLVDLALAVICPSVLDYLRSRKYFVSLIYHEELVSDPIGTLNVVFDSMGFDVRQLAPLEDQEVIGALHEDGFDDNQDQLAQDDKEAVQRTAKLVGLVGCL